MEDQQHSCETDEEPIVLAQDGGECSEISHEKVHAEEISDVEESLLRQVVNVLHSPFDRVAQCIHRRGIDPSHVTASKVPLSLGSIAIHQMNPLAGVLTFILSSAPDILDGKVARISGRTTREGALLDAFIDKVVNAYMYFYLLTQLPEEWMTAEMMLVFLMALNFSLDLVSQRLRGPLLQQMKTCLRVVRDPREATVVEGNTAESANIAGKQKAWAQFAAIMLMLISSHDPITQWLAVTAFSLSSVLAGKSISRRLAFIKSEKS